MTSIRCRPSARRPLAVALAGLLVVVLLAAAVVSPASASPVYHDTSYWYDAPPVNWGYYEDCGGCGAYDHWYDAPPALVNQGYYTYSPDNVSSPTVGGPVREKSTLTADKGTWTNDAANSDPTNNYTYRWQSCAADGSSCSDIGAATSASYLLPVGAAGKTFRVIVRATNASGFNEAASLATPVATLPIPSNTAAPQIPSAEPVRGTALTATRGTWDDATTATFEYQWQRCVTPSTPDCADITGATTTAYTPVLADLGKYLRIVVASHNAGTPTATAASGFTGKVQDAAPAGTAPNDHGGLPVTPGGGASGGAGGGSRRTEDDTPGAARGAAGVSGDTPKDRGALNGTGATDDAVLKAVFASTKTTTMSTVYGTGATIAGRLTTKSGDPIPNAKLIVTAKLTGGGSFDDQGVRTDADGRFTITLPRNVLSQTVRVSYRSHANDDAAADSESLTLRVKATAALTVSASGTNVTSGPGQRGRVVARNGSTLTFRARVDGPIPVGGKTVQLQSRCTAKGCANGWANFGPTGQRTDSRGVFVWRVKTNGTIGKVTYRFRLVVPEVDGASNDWPFATGYSPTRSLTINGGAEP